MPNISNTINSIKKYHYDFYRKFYKLFLKYQGI